MLRSLLRGNFPKATVALVFSAVLVTVGPAFAAEVGGESATVTSGLAVGKKPSVPAMRAVLRQPRQLNCCDAWYRRQFVLILGIGY